MKTKITILISVLAIGFSCRDLPKNRNDVSNSNTETVSKEQSIVRIGEFNQELNLFLDFYRTMNPLEYRQRTYEEVIRKRLFYLDSKDLNSRSEDLPLSALLISENFSNSDSLVDINDFRSGFDSNIYYPINTSEKSYYAKVIAHFDSVKLKSISLLAPSFLTTSDSENFKMKRIDEGKKYRDEIIKMYSTKYGKPNVSKIKFSSKENEPMGLYELIGKDKILDKNIYTFTDNEKTIEITFQCCMDFQMKIKYMLTSDYIIKKNKEQLQKTNKTEEQKKAKKKTLEEI